MNKRVLQIDPEGDEFSVRSRLYHCSCIGHHSITVGYTKEVELAISNKATNWDKLWVSDATVDLELWESGNRGDEGLRSRIVRAIQILLGKRICIDALLLTPEDAEDLAKELTYASTRVAKAIQIATEPNKKRKKLRYDDRY